MYDMKDHEKSSREIDSDWCGASDANMMVPLKEDKWLKPRRVSSDSNSHSRDSGNWMGDLLVIE